MQSNGLLLDIASFTICFNFSITFFLCSSPSTLSWR